MIIKSVVLILSLLASVHLASLKKVKKTQAKQNGAPDRCVIVYKDCLNLNPNDSDNHHVQICEDDEDLMMTTSMMGVSAIKVGRFLTASFYVEPFFGGDHEDFSTDLICLADFMRGERNDRYASVKLTKFIDPDQW